MDSLEQDDTQEIFQECDDDFLTSGESNVEREGQENYQDFDYSKQTKNNQHVVHVGIVVVLLTICLGLTNVPKCLVNCVENAPANEKVQENKQDLLNHLQQTEKIGNRHILERLLEYKDICKDLEIFTKDIKQKEQEKQKQNDKNAEDSEEIDYNNDLIDMEVSSSGAIEENDILDLQDNSGGGSSGQSGDCANINPQNPQKTKKSKYSIKTTNNKNGFNKYNKSTKTKFPKNQKKDLNLNKKNSTAEPIIYLFALVFIYLLLKAASDINQHYKSQNKNDKRLRRCSLQSYAQSHRPDRRASKASTTELALKQKQQLKHQHSLTRCSDKDQPTNYHYNYHHHQQPQHQPLMEASSQKSSEIKQQTTTGTPPVHPNICSSNKWQLLRQHTTTQSLDNSDILHTPGGNAEMFTPRMTRRCSVPAALSFQRQNISTASPLSVVNEPTNLNVSLSRRTSIVASSLPLGMDPNESLITETKRRVRMINRH